MIIGIKRTSLLAFSVFLFSVSGIAQPSQEPAPSASTGAVKDIQLSFKRDPRVVDPYRGLGPWVSGSNFSGATAQDTVEVRAEGLSAAGKGTKINPEWVTSDTDIVTVSPNQGDEVKIAVHKAGESTLKVSYLGLSKQLVVRSKYVGKYIVFEISPGASPKPNGPAAANSEPVLKAENEQISYAAGMRLAKTLRKQSVEGDPALVSQAMKDVLSGGPTLMSDEQADRALHNIETDLNVTEAILERKQAAERNKQAGERFLAENKKRDGVVTLPSGLQYKVIDSGHGKKPSSSDIAVCHYKGSLIDGTEFDNSYKHKNHEPVSFPLRGVISGWQQALKLMPEGSRWQLFVPPALAYGERGVPRAKIPPNATLVFEVELISVKEPQRQKPASAEKADFTLDQIDAMKKAIQQAKDGRATSETSR